MASAALTKKNAEKLADKLYQQLDTDDKLSGLDDADEIDVTITQEGAEFTFNVATGSDEDSDADSSSTDADSSSDDADEDDSSDSYSDTVADDDTDEDY
jgi:hypothetical protein